MEALFHGAYLTVCRQLGMEPGDMSDVGSGQGPDADAARFLKWAGSLEADEDLGQDARMMVPVFYDLGRRKTKVWVFLGWKAKRLDISFVNPPRVVGWNGAGLASPRRLLSRFFAKEANPPPEIDFDATYKPLATPVTAEVYVTKILNRDEFRRHCDTHETASAIFENLK